MSIKASSRLIAFRVDRIRAQAKRMGELLLVPRRRTEADSLERELRSILRKRDRKGANNGQKRILMYSMIPWSQGCMEHVLSTALRLRGHGVASVVCGGLLPDCEMHYYDFDRPPCDRCLANAKGLAKPYCVDPLLSTDYITSNDIEEARALVAMTSTKDLEMLTYNGVPVGQIARFHVNVFYQTFLVALDDTQTDQFRRFAEASVLLTKSASALIDHVKPDLVVVSNGKAFTYRPFFLVAKQKGIPVVTWEEHAFDNTMKFVFNHNCYAGEIHLVSVWETEKEKELSADQNKDLDTYFAKWRSAEIAPFPYHKNTSSDTDLIYSTLGIQKTSPIVACFPNMVRDTSAFDRDVGFDSLLQWIVKTVQYAATRPHLQFVIKAHPAERCLPEKYAKYNRFFICEEVRRHFSPVPANVHLLEGDSPINSYSLIEKSDVVVVYTSTMGIECALNGRLACVVGDVHYRGKGFTRDISCEEDLWAFLDGGPPYQTHISEDEVRLARRYAYLWRFRHPVTMPFYDTERLTFSLPDASELGPGTKANPTIDRLCSCIIHGRPFIDVC